MLRRRVSAFALACLIVVVVWSTPPLGASTDTLPDRLTDQAFWTLSEQLSEPDGYFRSDNLLSNELYFPEILDGLVERVPPGGVYLGVGPEQNFSYISAVNPRMVFITDVRRGNLHLQLMYKALFELSTDRAEFVSRLFTKPRPVQLTRDSPIRDIMDAYWSIDTSARATFDGNVKAVQDHLTKARALPLSADDLAGIADVYGAFYWFGPSIAYNSSSSGGAGRANMANYYQLMLTTDTRGVVRSFLASDSSFRAIKDLHARNLIVPVVGDFGGPRALRAIGAWVRERGASVSMFYVSNVEQYLRQQGTESAFCASFASMPLVAGSTFVRSQSGGAGFRNLLGDMITETASCVDRPAGIVPGAAGQSR